MSINEQLTGMGVTIIPYAKPKGNILYPWTFAHGQPLGHLSNGNN